MNLPKKRSARSTKAQRLKVCSHHWVLVNRKTRKVSSNNHWQVALAARAVQSHNTAGIASLLPISKARQLLEYNDVVEKQQRGQKSKIASVKVRSQAKAIIPELIKLYITRLPKHLFGGRGHFAVWVHRELGSQDSDVTEKLKSHGFNELIDAQNRPRWWHDQLKKCRVNVIKPPQL